MLGDPRIPPGKISYDELLGEEVEKFHGRLTVSLPLLSAPPGADLVELRVRSQGCLEDELCYPPTEQRVTVRLPAEPPAGQAGLSSDGSTTKVLPGGIAPTTIFGEPAGAALAPEQAFTYEAIAWDAGTVLVRFTAQSRLLPLRGQV